LLSDDCLNRHRNVHRLVFEQRLIEGDRQLRLLLLFVACLRGGDVPDHFRIFRHENVSAGGFHVHRDFAHDFIARFRFLGINSFGQCYGNHAAGRNSRRVIRWIGRSWRRLRGASRRGIRVLRQHCQAQQGNNRAKLEDIFHAASLSK